MRPCPPGRFPPLFSSILFRVLFSDLSAGFFNDLCADLSTGFFSIPSDVFFANSLQGSFLGFFAVLFGIPFAGLLPVLLGNRCRDLFANCLKVLCFDFCPDF